MAGMTCPKCGAKTDIVDSRPRRQRQYRRRWCGTCDWRFTTTEEPTGVNFAEMDLAWAEQISRRIGRAMPKLKILTRVLTDIKRKT